MQQCKNIDTLKKKIKGRIITKNSIEYDKARVNWDPYTTHFPCYIVYPLFYDDIIKCINWCCKNNIKFRVRGARSHCLGYDFSSINNGLVCNIENFNKINYKSNKVVVGAGTVIGDLVYSLAKKGIMFPFGDSYGIGIGGITQGGGIGLQNKQMGLCCDNLLECILITAHGKILLVNEKTNSDLFWALRGGGGGNFGVITEMTLNFKKAPVIVTHVTINWKDIDLKTVRDIIIEWMNTNLYDNINICRNLSITKETNSDLFNANIQCLIYNNDESLFIFKKISNWVKTVTVGSYYDTVVNLLEKSKNDIKCELNFKFLGYFSDTILDEYTVDIIVNYFNENDSDLFFLEFGGKFHIKNTDTAFYWRNSILYFELSKIWPVYKNDKIIFNKNKLHKCNKSFSKNSVQNEINEPDFTSYTKTARILGKKYKTGYINVPNNTYKYSEIYEKVYYGKNIKRLKEIKFKYDPNNFFNFSQSIKGLSSNNV